MMKIKIVYKFLFFIKYKIIKKNIMLLRSMNVAKDKIIKDTYNLEKLLHKDSVNNLHKNDTNYNFSISICLEYKMCIKCKQR